MSWKSHFSRFLSAAPQRLHFAAHSHHPWPDVSFEAQQQAWLDAARLADLKWDKVFGEVVPAAQGHLARALGLPDPRTIAFAPNTHEFLMRLLSCLPQPARVLTTDGEFHSFSRQMKRMEEDGSATVTRVPLDPHGDFPRRFAAAASRGGFDLVYFSQVFFNTGLRVPDLRALVASVKDDRALVVVDGYHGFMAVPTDISGIASRAFYLAGGYKYAMAGEGACFMHCPPGYAPRPRDTGWFASFGTLAQAQAGAVPYAEGGGRFLGATFDPTALYRMVAVQDWLARLGVGVAQIRAHVVALQRRFLEHRERDGPFKGLELLLPDEATRGNFLVFRDARASQIHDRLLEASVVVDCRDDRLRVGFGMHQDAADVDGLFERAAGGPVRP
ncbi:MAG: aminotransferase class V-fold PLP-dependent enzyme [Gammaproteobacteria bacterium]